MRRRNWIAFGTCLMMLAGSSVALAQSERELPQGAKPGECYARVFVPPVYTTQTEQVLKDEGSSRIEIVPAKYEWTTEQVLTKEASERLEVVPAQYEWVTEKMLVKPAETVWKKGSGPIERVDNGTGEIMCLVEEPAVYKTVRKRVQKSAATTRTVKIPAEYKTVKVQKMVSPPKERRVEIPAEYQMLTKKSLVSDGRVEWRPVLCQTNLSGDVISSIQRSLQSAGFNPGPIDGQIGTQTMTAIRSFQKAKGLAQGALTTATLDALNVRVGS